MVNAPLNNHPLQADERSPGLIADILSAMQSFQIAHSLIPA